jgi:hypothetical protein
LAFSLGEKRGFSTTEKYPAPSRKDAKFFGSFSWFWLFLFFCFFNPQITQIFAEYFLWLNLRSSASSADKFVELTWRLGVFARAS